VTTNLFKRLQQLLPDEPVLSGAVSVAYDDGTALIDMPGGGQLRVRNPFGHQPGSRVYIQAQVITGDAPQLPYVLIEI